MARNKNTEWLSSDDDDEEVLKVQPKFSKIESDVEDGELSSDNGDESNLEKLFKNKEDRKRLLNMTEKEREEEIFKRSLEFSDIKSRQKAVKKLNEQKKKDSNQEPKNKKRSLAEVFGRGSDDESIFSSSSIDSISMPTKRSKVSPPINPRQKALENQKSSKNEILSQLHENRKKKNEKLEKLEKGNKDVIKKSAFDSDFSDSEEKKLNNVDRQSIISSSSSEQMDGAREDFEDKTVEEMEDLMKIRLSRHKMEGWVHMPFFKDLIKGCFVRVNIGEGPEVIPVYRIAEIIDVVETVKIYDLGKTRTNVGLRLRIGKSVTMFRLPFVSNQNFQQSEFDSWRRRVIADGFSLPKLSFIEEKFKRIKEYANYSINNEETMKEVLKSKQRFQKGPVNIALRKAELTRLKMAADNEGDISKANEFQDEIDELNMKAEKLERKRTEGIKNISYINQRNREATMEHVEMAIELEMVEKREWEKKGGDPLDREPTKPVLNYKKKKEERLAKEAEELRLQLEQQQNVTEESGKVVSSADGGAVMSRGNGESSSESKINIHNIHDFELNLDIKLEQHGGGHAAKVVAPAALLALSNLTEDSALLMSAITSSLVYKPAAAAPVPVTAGGNNRRVLNLQDYKKRKGLI